MSKDSQSTQHPYIPVLIEDLNKGTISRRHFLRTATLLGLSAVTAYKLSGEANPFINEAKAAESLPKVDIYASGCDAWKSRAHTRPTSPKNQM